MIDYAQALSLVLKCTEVLPTESVSLQAAAGRILAEPIVAPWQMPRFDQSAVDGYAVRTQDISFCSTSTPVQLPLVETRCAGGNPQSALLPSTAIKIFTGAALPPGTDSVIMRETVEEHDSHIVITCPAAPGANIRYAGEEYAAGATVLQPGVSITPAVLALLGSLNRHSVLVHQQPRIACIVTGDELLETGEAVEDGKIYDANSWGLQAALHGLGINEIQLHRVKDLSTELRRVMAQAMRSSDVLITAGGISMGDCDLVRPIALHLGFDEVFWRVAVKPGKPLFFGHRRHVPKGGRLPLFFGLPGNPVAVLVMFHQFARPALLKMMGCTEVENREFPAHLLTPLRKKAGRLEWVRARMHHADGQITVQPSTGQESHMLGGLCNADCLIEFPAEATRLDAGETVRIIPLRWSV